MRVKLLLAQGFELMNLGACGGRRWLGKETLWCWTVFLYLLNGKKKIIVLSYNFVTGGEMLNLQG